MSVTATFIFGRLLRRYRLKAGLSQEALAERASLSTDAIGMLERGIRRTPYIQTVEALANALRLNDHDRIALSTAARRPTARQRPALTLPPLPTPLTPLIGRSRELEIVRSWFTVHGPRLITVTGAGGVGKTRFALELARQLCESFEDDVTFVSLSALLDPADIPASILTCLNRKDDGTPASLGVLCAHVRTRRVLFVIDNFEQVIAGAPTICEFLEHCPNVTVIATSREALRVRGEREFALAPLEARSAVDLFVERGHAVRPYFELDGHEATVFEICRRLDCLPLAIELAAARLRWESVQTLSQAVLSPLSALISGRRDAPPRQQTMRAAIDWSYQLLSDAERTVLCVCSLFVGGGTPEAIAAVASATGRLAEDVGYLLIELAQKHLLRPFTFDSQPARIEMLEVIREYARSQFESLESANAYQRAFAVYYHDIIGRAARGHASASYGSWLDLIAGEYTNICAALRWCALRDRPLGLRVALLLTQFWERKGLYADARTWLETLTNPLEETLMCEDPTVSWRIAISLALSCFWTADSQRACELNRRALVMARSQEDPAAIAKSLNNLGIALLDVGQAHEARNALEESLAIKESHGDAWSLACTTGNLGIALGACGEYQEALRCHQRARTLFRSAGDQWGEIGELNSIGDVHCGRRNYREAAVYYAASLEANTEGIRAEVADSIEGLLAVAASERRFRRVAKLAGAVKRIRGESGRPQSPSAAARFETACTAARISLGDLLFETTSAAGAEMSLNDAIEAALKGCRSGSS